MLAVWANPGRRFGAMVEILSLALLGGLLGAAWAVLGTYGGSFLIHRNLEAAFAVRAIFLVVALFFHGFLRSRSPRLWHFVLLQIVVCIIGLTSTTLALSQSFVTQLVYPLLVGSASVFLTNLLIFPEFSTSFLGKTTIETLNETAKVMRNAGNYFVSLNSSEDSPAFEDKPPEKQAKKRVDIKLFNGAPNQWPNAPSKLKSAQDAHNQDTPAGNFSLKTLTSAKPKLRSDLSKQDTAQRECQFEIAFGILPPRDMGQISKKLMSGLVTNTIALVGACEMRYALLGDNLTYAGESPEQKSLSSQKETSLSDEKSSTSTISPTGKSDKNDFGAPGNTNGAGDTAQNNVIAFKAKKEIEFGDKLFNDIFATLLTAHITQVPKAQAIPQVPHGILTHEIALYIDSMRESLKKFDESCQSALEISATLQAEQEIHESIDVMPREEVFLLSSFLLNVRQAAMNLLNMLEASKLLVEKRNARKGRRRFYAPRIQWRKWLYSGDHEDEALPAIGRRAAGREVYGINSDRDSQSVNSEDPLIKDSGALDREDGTSPLEERTAATESIQNPTPYAASSQRSSRLLAIRGILADILEWFHDSEDVAYAIKVTIAAMLVLWPAFVPSLSNWYYENRGTWAGLQVVQVFEVAIGTSLWTFVLRMIGTALGCLWGWAAYEARPDVPAVCAVMISIGLFPAAYVLLGSKYPKAGMVSVVSINVVALSTELRAIPGTGTDNFLKRLIAFQIGGMVALLVELVILPVKASTRMVESLTDSIQSINRMEGCIAFGVEEKTNVTEFPSEVTTRFEHSSEHSKSALTAAETFLPFAMIEPRLKGSFAGLSIVYKEIIFVLRQIIYRMDNMLQLRMVYGSGPLEGFNTQLYPYRRNLAASITIVLFAAQEAMITRMPLPQYLPSARLAHLRLINKVREVLENHSSRSQREETRLNQTNFISWNASSAAQAEVIEYLEELADLMKLLVGTNEFRSGLLTQSSYSRSAGKIQTDVGDAPMEVETEHVRKASDQGIATVPRSLSTANHALEDNGEVPASLQRIHSRKRKESASRPRKASK
ncbi:hypothetical protein MMC25_007504 [Agyrium rufum]|nr:hypothetical protein [Agyrium rufum]